MRCRPSDLSNEPRPSHEAVEACNGSWEAGYFATLARNYGFGINGDAFEQWAMSIPLHSVDHHRDNLFQIEAIFMGQAGLLEPDSIPERYRKEASEEGYFEKLLSEYKYLAHKFSLQPIDRSLWKFLRLRPQNFPHIRIAQLANLYYQRSAGLSALVGGTTIEEVAALMQTQVTPIGKRTTHSALKARKATRPCQVLPFNCSSSTPLFRYFSPTADTSFLRNSATVPSDFL